MVGDACLIYFSFWSAYKIRFDCQLFLDLFPIVKGRPGWQLYQEALRAIIPLWILVFAIFGRLYRAYFSDAADDFLSLFKGITLAILLVTAGTFLYRQYEYSRLVIALSWVLSLFIIFVFRELWKGVVLALYDQVASKENVILIAKGKVADTISTLIKKDPHRNLMIYSEPDLEELKAQVDSGLDFQEVIVQGQLLNDKRVEELLDQSEEKGIEVKILPDFLEMRLGEILIDNSLGVPILHLKPLSLHGFRFWMKRLFDLSVSITIITVFFLPFLLISILIICESRGGIFFCQERIGFKEKRFKCLKFRTMYQNAETLLEKMKLPSFRGGPAFKMRDDPRVTRVGKFLRKFSLDECAQILNVLKGEMSLVGPRPQVLAEAKGNPQWARKRYRIFPGITGLWQVSGRADLSYEDMMRLDIYYLENWSPGLDLKIILKTIPVVLSGKGAY